MKDAIHILNYIKLTTWQKRFQALELSLINCQLETSDKLPYFSETTVSSKESFFFAMS